jgi:hypothetical protein
VVCSDSHSALVSREGGKTPITLVLSDQSFPPIIEGGEGENCVRILRVEDGSLGEIVDLALEMFPKGIPGNSVVLLGSGTHLLRVGSSGYSRAWVESSGRLAKLCHSVQVCPLPPILSGPNPGRIFRYVGEVRCWVANYFKSDARGMEEVWDLALSQLSQNTSPCTPLATLSSYTELFPADASCSNLIPITFASASSCPDSVFGPSCKAVKELLLAISLVLNRDFHTLLASELNLPRGHAISKGTKELHIVLIGGSHMHYTAPHLKALGVTVTDLSVPGWISNVRNGQSLMDRVRCSEPPSDAVYVFDVLGNSGVRFRQEDGGSSLPIKLNGSFHLLGELEMMQQEHVELALSPIEHLYKNLLRSNCKLFNPPIPRFLFGSCCPDLAHGSNIRMGGHSEKMLGEHCRIRNNLKSILLKDGIRNMRVLDTLGTLTHKSTVAEQLTSLKSLVARDNVHLTAQGYKALAEGIYREALNFGITRSKGKHSLSGLQMVRVAEWHGFVSNQGVGKVSLKAAKRPLGGRSHPYQKKK